MIPQKAKELIGKLFSNDDEIVYYAEYDDGCAHTITRKGAESWQGKHSPHLRFYPDDKPVREWHK